MRLFRPSKVRKVTPVELQSLVDENALVIDVRTQHEWRAGHLPFARHIPLESLGARLSELEPERLTVFVCRSGNRSGDAARALDEHGYNVANLAGGMVSCRLAGLPVVADDGRPGTVA